MNYLTAHWKKLIVVSYEVNPLLLINFVPKGTKLDSFNNKYYLSIVGFLFENTRFLGIRFPHYHTFEEVNARFYVKFKDNDLVKKGVAFIKEFVPFKTVSFIAKTFYKEKYYPLPMQHTLKQDPNYLDISYHWRTKNKLQKLHVISTSHPIKIKEESLEGFIAEHYWGYTKVGNRVTYEYHVQHPKWKKYEIKKQSIDINFAESYGEKFSFLNNKKPDSVMLLEGSEIKVSNKRKLIF